ncbi:intermembrane lipid transfer protein VPS13C-like [Liolophura sinensis]|uniref:intermembrane lipid transfer protein VPS13C-like n=1 Tax=Liolophura sinensis TaxID=3198878 RepID=UPI00315954D6
METVEEVMLRAYDKFNIQLQSIQVLYATGNEDWRSARRMGNSNMHVLRPISIHLCLQKCMFDKDPRMAKMKVSGELPLLSLGLSDYRLQQLIDLGMSIPLPEPPDTDMEDIFALTIRKKPKGPSTLPSAAEPDVSPNSLKKVVNPPPGGTGKSSSLQRATSQEYVNATDMELNFEIKKVEITLSQRINKQEVPMVRLLVERLGTTMKMRTFDMSVEAYLGGIYLQHLKLKDSDQLRDQLINNKLLTVTDEGPIINIINTPAHKDPKFKLLTVSYLKANGDGPEFSTTYGNTEQSINVHFSALEVLLHLGALLGLMEFAQSLQPNIPPSTVKEVKTTEKDEAGKEKDGTVDKPKRKRKVKPKDPKIIDIKVKANLDSFGVAICTADKLITDVKIKGIESTVAVQQAKTTVAAVIRDMIVFDPSPKSLYPQILSIEGSEVLKADIVAYNGGTEGEKFADMNCVDTSVAVKIGCMKITFLNKFVTDLLAYMDHFQTAKDALKEAGETMAEKSLEQAQNIQATAARILLDIQMKAPLIVVPQSSTSSNVLCVDLGMLTLGNEFQMAKAKASDGSPAVMDQMKIELTSLKLSRYWTFFIQLLLPIADNTEYSNALPFRAKSSVICCSFLALLMTFLDKLEKCIPVIYCLIQLLVLDLSHCMG